MSDTKAPPGFKPAPARMSMTLTKQARSEFDALRLNLYAMTGVDMSQSALIRAAIHIACKETCRQRREGWTE